MVHLERTPCDHTSMNATKCSSILLFTLIFYKKIKCILIYIKFIPVLTTVILNVKFCMNSKLCIHNDIFGRSHNKGIGIYK